MARALGNLIGNCVATVVMAAWTATRQSTFSTARN
jgi:Na+/H+-dicarboxylate symporter